MANRTKRTPSATSRFLEALRQGASIAKGARAAGIARSTAYEWREEDEAFARDWDEAVDEWTDALEDEANRRAHEGVEVPHWYEGDVCGHSTKYSDSLLQFLLRARRPEKYADRVEHSGAVDTGLATLLKEIDGKAKLLPPA